MELICFYIKELLNILTEKGGENKMNNNEKEMRNSRNSFELEGNVANINDIYTNQNGKKY